MTQYLLNNVHPEGHKLEPADLQRVIGEVMEVTRQMQTAGVWVFAMPLADPEASTVVRHTGGEVKIADGPFAEAKEYVGGFTVVDVVDLDAALHWAGIVSAATGLPVEVRPAPSLAG